MFLKPTQLITIQSPPWKDQFFLKCNSIAPLRILSPTKMVGLFTQHNHHSTNAKPLTKHWTSLTITNHYHPNVHLWHPITIVNDRINQHGPLHCSGLMLSSGPAEPRCFRSFYCSPTEDVERSCRFYEKDGVPWLIWGWVNTSIPTSQKMSIWTSQQRHMLIIPETLPGSKGLCANHLG